MKSFRCMSSPNSLKLGNHRLGKNCHVSLDLVAMDVHHAPLKKGIQEMMSNIGEDVLAQAKQRLFDCLKYGSCDDGTVERSAMDWRVTSN